MKNITTSLYAIAKHTNFCNGKPTITEGKEYAIFKIYNGKYCKMVTVVDDNGNLEDWGASHFQFITK